MPASKLNISLDLEIAGWLRRRAAEEGKTMSRYLADLIDRDVRNSRDEAAAEGYRLLSAQGLALAEAAIPIAAETWPAWDQLGRSSDLPPRARARRDRSKDGRKAAAR